MRASLGRAGRWAFIIIAVSGCKPRCDREIRSRLGEDSLREISIERCDAWILDDDTRFYTLRATLRTKLSTADVAARLRLATDGVRPSAATISRSMGEPLTVDDEGKVLDGAARFDPDDRIVLRKIEPTRYRLVMVGRPQPDDESE